MNTEIVLKDYSELSLWQKGKLKFIFPRMFNNTELLLLEAKRNAEYSDEVTDERLYKTFMEQVANLMYFYNSDDFTDYRVIELSISYLESLNVPNESEAVRNSAKTLLEFIFEGLNPHGFFIES